MGFKYGTNRFSIRGFLAAFSRLFMESPSDVPGVFTMSDCKNDVGQWQMLLFTSDLSSQCQLERMIYCKCMGGKEHEFLLLHFRHPMQQHAVAILVLDRTPCTDDTRAHNNNNNNNNGSSRQLRQSSSIVSPSVSPTSARDSIFTTPNRGSAIQSYLSNTYGSYKELCDLDFSTSARPSAVQVSALLTALSNHSPLYDLYQYQCYWYAHTVWEALKRLFTDCRETTRCQGRSHYRGLKIEMADSVEVVCEQYYILWARIENAAEEKRRAKEDEMRQLRMQGQAEERVQSLARETEAAKAHEEIEQALARETEAARKAHEEIEQALARETEATRKANEEMRQKEEAMRKVEEAERKAEEATRREEAVRKAAEATRKAAEDTQRAMVECQAEMDRMRARLAQFERQPA